MNRRPANAWFSVVVPNPTAPTRLFCLPYAGGGASVFVPWARALSGPRLAVYGVQPPGRENRLADTPYVRMRDLVLGLADAIAPQLDRAFVLFGHSLGATVAFELAHELHLRGLRSPDLLIASGALAPHVPDDEEPLHTIADDDEFVFAVAERFGGVPQAVLEHAELRSVIAPALRADLTIHETYRCEPRAPLGVDLVAYGGTVDAKVDEAGLRAWSEHTTRTFACRLFEGDHFFLQSARDAVLDDVRVRLRIGA